jgi:hypothetical protein
MRRLGRARYLPGVVIGLYLVYHGLAVLAPSTPVFGMLFSTVGLLIALVWLARFVGGSDRGR